VSALVVDHGEMAFEVILGLRKRRRVLKKNERERPEGGRAWNRRSKALQQTLLERWGGVYGG